MCILTLGRTSLECLTIPAKVGGGLIEWSPDGAHILVAWQSRLHVFIASGDDDAILDAPVQISRCFLYHMGPEKITAARWSPDSQRIALTGGNEDGDDIGIKIFNVEHRNLMELVSFGGDAPEGEGFDDVSWYRDGSAVLATRHLSDGDMERSICPIDV